MSEALQAEAEGAVQRVPGRRLRNRVITSPQVLLATAVVAEDGGPVHAPNEENYKQAATADNPLHVTFRMMALSVRKCLDKGEPNYNPEAKKQMNHYYITHSTTGSDEDRGFLNLLNKSQHQPLHNRYLTALMRWQAVEAAECERCPILHPSSCIVHLPHCLVAHVLQRLVW